MKIDKPKCFLAKEYPCSYRRKIGFGEIMICSEDPEKFNLIIKCPQRGKLNLGKVSLEDTMI